MKNIFLLGLVLLLGSFSSTAAALLTSDKLESQVTAITNFDIDRYLGRWYEIARLPTYFEKQCLAPITVDYNRDGDEMTIINSCAQLSGESNVTYGIAYLSAENLNGDGKLVRSSMPSWLRWTHLGRGDYWIIYVDYLYAVVGSPDHKYLWIYSRQETPPLQDIQNLLSLAQQQGFESASMVFNYPSYYAK